MTKDAEDVCPEQIERAAAAAMSDTPARVIAEMLGAAEQVRSSDSMTRFAAMMRDVAGALEGVAQVARTAAARVAQAFAAYRDPDVALLLRRKAYGGMAEDAERWPDHWITYWCAGLLHRSCESDRHLLGCTCHCHRKGK